MLAVGILDIPKVEPMLRFEVCYFISPSSWGGGGGVIYRMLLLLLLCHNFYLVTTNLRKVTDHQAAFIKG